MQYKLPVDGWAGKNICLKMTGGIGDALISIGSSAALLKENFPCTVTACARDFQLTLLSFLKGVDYVLPVPKLNDPSVRKSFDIILDFENIFTEGRQIKDQDYYSLVESRLGFLVPQPELKIPYTDFNLEGGYVCLHASASNLNRKWPEKYWEELAFELLKRGINIVWLGTPEEYGFEGVIICMIGNMPTTAWSIKACGIGKDLEQQALILEHADYFIGNDSGFAHIAGILEKKGCVIFFTTHPKNVIKRYPTLKGVMPIDFIPTRSLNPHDEVSLAYAQSITPKSILAASTLIDYPVAKEYQFEKTKVKHGVVLINGEAAFKDELIKNLENGFEVLPLSVTESEIVRDVIAIIDLTESTMFFKGKTIRIRNNLESYLRAFREIRSSF